MTYIGAWCPEELVKGIEVWIKNEKNKRRVNRTDFLIEAATEKLRNNDIPIESLAAHRTGENRKEPSSSKIQKKADDIEDEVRRTVRSRRKPAA